jgi:hypothetical protein
VPPNPGHSLPNKAPVKYAPVETQRQQPQQAKVGKKNPAVLRLDDFIRQADSDFVSMIYDSDDFLVGPEPMQHLCGLVFSDSTGKDRNYVLHTAFAKRIDGNLYGRLKKARFPTGVRSTDLELRREKIESNRLKRMGGGFLADEEEDEESSDDIYVTGHRPSAQKQHTSSQHHHTFKHGGGGFKFSAASSSTMKMGEKKKEKTKKQVKFVLDEAEEGSDEDDEDDAFLNPAGEEDEEDEEESCWIDEDNVDHGGNDYEEEDSQAEESDGVVLDE